MWSNDNENQIHTAVQKCGNDPFEYGRVAEWQAEFRPAHAGAEPGGRDHGKRHDMIPFPTAPRFRTAISSATMLTAISGSVGVPVFNPRGG